MSLQQVISGNYLLKTQAEPAALNQIKSYLRAKYDVENEFTNTAKYDNGAIYKATNRVYLDAPAYSATATYILGQLKLQGGNVYRCTTAIPIAEAFTIGKWQLLGAQYTMFYAPVPQPVFNFQSLYNKGDLVFWKDKVYTCVIGSVILSHDSAIQSDSTQNYPILNVFPDDPKNGKAYWGDGVAYSVAAGSILDTTKFTQGDNRNQQLVLYVLDVLIYHLYRRIPPAVVPEIRIVAYRSVIEWLKNVAKGNDVVADIVKIQPSQGQRIRWGSRPKQNNFY